MIIHRWSLGNAGLTLLKPVMTKLMLRPFEVVHGNLSDQSRSGLRGNPSALRLMTWFRSLDARIGCMKFWRANSANSANSANQPHPESRRRSALRGRRTKLESSTKVRSTDPWSTEGNVRPQSKSPSRQQYNLRSPPINATEAPLARQRPGGFPGVSCSPPPSNRTRSGCCCALKQCLSPTRSLSTLNRCPYRAAAHDSGLWGGC